jgi:hypothetical protein
MAKKTEFELQPPAEAAAATQRESHIAEDEGGHAVADTASNARPVADKRKPTTSVIGKASATEREPNSSQKFSFWLGPDVVVNPFDIVEANQMEDTRTFGLGTNIRQITDAPSHLSNFISSDFGSVEAVPQTPRQGANVAEVSVLANNREPQGIYMPVQSEATERFADEAGIQVALGIEKIEERDSIPAGVIQMSNQTAARTYLHRDYVLGPEGAHVNISGISGLATKTRYAMSLIQSILQTIGQEKRRHMAPKLKGVGLGWVNLKVMRRTCASLMRELGVDPKVVADQLGHTVDVDINVYASTALEHREEAVKTLETALRVM